MFSDAGKRGGNVQEQEWRPSVNPWFIAMSVILPTFMEVLDVSIANVALDHIAGSLSASYDQATWVLTSYLIANAIVLPTTGWLGRRFGRKRVLELCLDLHSCIILLWSGDEPSNAAPDACSSRTWRRRAATDLDVDSDGKFSEGEARAGTWSLWLWCGIRSNYWTDFGWLVNRQLL